MYKFNSKTDILYQKQNFIELKVLEYALKWDKEWAKRVFDIRHILSWEWFEYYINNYLINMWFKMEEKTWWNKPDWWIDLNWFLWNKKVYIQCKKYIESKKLKWEVSVNKLRDFFWGVISFNWCNLSLNTTIMYYVTTWFFSNYSKNFAEKNNIDLLDFKDIADISKYYSINDFEKDMWKDFYKMKNTKFNQLNLVDFTFEELTDDEKLDFWKKVRFHLVEENQLDETNVWNETFEDKTLVEFWKVRTSEWLDSFFKNCNSYEREKILKFKKEINLGIKILQN